MRYYQCDTYPIEFVLSENIEKCFAAHNHVGHYVISVVMQGMVTVCLQGRELTCHRGDVFIIPPYAVHSVCQGRESCLLSMCMGTAFVENTPLETARDIVRKLSEDAVKQGVFGTEQKNILSACLEAAYALRRQGSKKMDADIKILADKIIRCPEQELTVDSLAADIFMSKYYFIRKFKSSMGMTPHQFHIQNRIRKAQRLLAAQKTVGTMAAEMGFYDQSHFDRAFHKIVGISPSEYLDSKRVIRQSR